MRKRTIKSPAKLRPKGFILDLRTITEDGGDEWADSPARYELTDEILKYAGKIIRVKITTVRKPL